MNDRLGVNGIRVANGAFDKVLTERTIINDYL